MILPFPVITLNDNRWVLLQDWTGDFGGFTITVPKGFRTDFASIPRFLWPIRASHELSLCAPLVHDFLYQTSGDPVFQYPDSVWPPFVFDRADADDLFYDIMRHEGVSLRHALIAWAAVRLAGWAYWGSSE